MNSSYAHSIVFNSRLGFHLRAQHPEQISMHTKPPTTFFKWSLEPSELVASDVIRNSLFPKSVTHDQYGDTKCALWFTLF